MRSRDGAVRILVGGMLAAGISSGPAWGGETVVSDGMDVAIEYTLTVDGTVVDSTQERGPFHYVHGLGQVIPGLERALAGARPGDHKQVVVMPEEGYGPVDPAGLVEVARSQLPADAVVEPGTILRGVSAQGKSFRARVVSVQGETVTLDLNHPFAGKTLQFDVTVLSVQPPVPPAAVEPAATSP